ncbi:MAG TPA: hypothetical protein VN213_10755 [Solirubrobacteraceae bacterium]|nr:hypothetical protein [Solirubrobacteraceae bacterium]
MAALAARAFGVVLAGDDRDPPLLRDDVAVAQTERLTDPHPRPRQQREQKPVAASAPTGSPPLTQPPASSVAGAPAQPADHARAAASARSHAETA